jgi:uncharacterized protein YbaR (Trm112 family)
MIDTLLGVTTCPTCQKRFRILKKHEAFIGKTISCPKCNRPFAIQLETPAPIEQAAMASAPATSPNGETRESVDGIAAPKKRKRTKVEIRKVIYKRIRKEFGPFMQQLQALMDCDSYSEEKIRVWCIGVLKSALGYNDEDLEYELAAVNKKIDIAVKHDGKVILIIECKKHNTLAKKAREQAVTYAVNKSADWAVVTNGQTWELHRVIPVAGQDPQVVEVFNTSLLDDDGLSQYDVERMYLLTKRALLRGETEKEFHRAQCLNDKRLFSAMLSDRAIKSIRRSLYLTYKKEFKQHVKLTDSEVHEALKELIRPDELGGDS